MGFITILFTLYIDTFLIRLKLAHIGCHMNHIFTFYYSNSIFSFTICLFVAMCMI